MSSRYRNISGPMIRERRMAKKYSQEDLAAKLQLAGLTQFDRVCVAKVESQIRSLFDWELAVIASVLGSPVSDLICSEKLSDDLSHLIAGEKKR